MQNEALELKGWDVEEIARRGAISGSLLRQVRDHESAAKRIRRLVLFGENRDLTIQHGDPPLVQILFEQAKLYQTATENDDTDAKQRILASMTTSMLGVANKQQSMFDSLLGLVKDMYKANLKANGRDIDMSDSELIQLAAKASSPDAAE